MWYKAILIINKLLNYEELKTINAWPMQYIIVSYDNDHTCITLMDSTSSLSEISSQITELIKSCPEITGYTVVIDENYKRVLH